MQQPSLICDPPRVTILMGVYNGAPFLAAQLASIAAQSHRDWHLICSDDGSADQSRGILAEFARDHPRRVTLRQGPGQGFAANYLSLIAGLDVGSGPVCLADQDDVWAPDKIARALEMTAGMGQPTLYCARQALWFAHNGRVLLSPSVRQPCGLKNALAENIATGNTVLLNPAAVELARRAARRTRTVFAHDWWLYLLITACGGRVIFDNGSPRILYRQHSRNAIGAGRSLPAQVRRKLGVLRGEFHARVNSNIAALEQVEDLLTADARATLRDFSQARQLSGLARLRALRRIGPYRQSWLGNLGFWGAASLGRV